MTQRTLDTVHEYPHQTGDGSVSHDSLAQDFQNNPEAYHPALHDHVQRLVGGAAIQSERVHAPGNDEVTLSDDRKRYLLDALAQANLAEDMMWSFEDGEESAYVPYPDWALDSKDILYLLEQDNAYIVGNELFNQPGPFSADIAQKLIDLHREDILAMCAEKFEGINIRDLATNAIDRGYWDVALEYARKLDIESQRIIVDIILQTGSRQELEVICQCIDALPGVDHTKIADCMLAAGMTTELAHQLYRFRNLDISIAHKLLEVGEAYRFGVDVALAASSFGADGGEKVARALMAGNRASIVSEYINKFEGITPATIYELMEEGMVEITYLEIPGVDEARVVWAMLAQNEIYTLAGALDRLHETDIVELFQVLLERNLNTIRRVPQPVLDDMVANHGDTLRPMLAAYSETELFDHDRADDQGFEQFRCFSVEVLGDQAPDFMRIQGELFGNNGTIESAAALKNLLEGTISAEIKLLGVTDTGLEGVEQLKNILVRLKEKLRSCQFGEDVETLLGESKIARAVFMDVTEYQDRDGYGDHSEFALRKKIQYRNKAVQQDLIEPMYDEYVPSKTYEILTIKHDKDRETWPQDLVDRYQVLVADINAAAEAYASRGGFARLNEDLRQQVGEVITKLETQLDSVDPSDPAAPHKVRGLTAKLERLQGYVARTESDTPGNKRAFSRPHEFRQAFTDLEPYDELHPKMRQMIFAWAMHKNSDTERSQVYFPTEPSVESIADVREMIDHIVNQETFGTYFTDKKEALKFKRMSSTKALEEGLNRHQKKAERGDVTQIQFIPTRGSLLEISGQIADACWADQNDSIAEDNFNFTALIMRARPGTKHERLVGAGLLIETTDDLTGEDVLVLRGTNPTENYINKVDVADFYQAITSYVKDLAEARGMKPAIVIDDHTGGSGTNRPVLFEHLSSIKRTLTRVNVDAYDTTFNGYDITQDTYALA